MIHEFQVDQGEMARCMANVMHAISAKPIRPIYSGVHVRAKDNMLLLTATDGEMSVRASVSANVSVEGGAVYPARLMNELLRKLKSGDVQFAVDDKGLAKIRAAGSKTSMVCMDGNDFPDIHGVDNGHTVHLPASALKNAIQTALFAASTDEARKVMTGILTEVGRTETRLVAIDGFRLAVRYIEAENEIPDRTEHLTAIIPGRFMGELAKVLPDDETGVELRFSESHAEVLFSGTAMYTTLLTGEFIDYKHLINANTNTDVLVNCEAMRNALDRCGLMAREAKTNLITMDVQKDSILMSSVAELGDVHEDVPADVTGEPLKISFNAQYIGEVLKNVETENAHLLFTGSLAPCIIRPDNGGAYTYLVLPVRTL